MTKTRCTARCPTLEQRTLLTWSSSSLLLIIIVFFLHCFRGFWVLNLPFLFIPLVRATLKSLSFFVFRYEMMTLCWQFNLKARPTFVYLISLLEKDLSDTFHDISFYRTLTEDHLKGLLSSHYKHKNKSEKVDSSPSIDSSAEKKNVPVENYA